MDNPVVIAVLLLMVVGLVVLLQRQRASAAKAARGGIEGMDELLAKGRYGEAAQLALKHDRFTEAVDLYLRANEPARAAQVAGRAGNHRQAGELYERAGDVERAAMAYEKAGMADRAKELRASKVSPHPTSAEAAATVDTKARARAAEESFLAVRTRVGGDATRLHEVQSAAQSAAEELLALGEIARAADVYRDADMTDEAVHLYVNVLGAPGSAAPLVAARGFHERAAELYEMAGEKERAALTWANLARASGEPERLLDRVESLSVVVAKALLREITAARPLNKATAPLHYRYGLVLERGGDVDRAIDVFQAMQAGVGNYKDIEARVRRLARGEGVSMKAPAVPRDLFTTKGTFAVASNSEVGLADDASKMLREASKAAAARARRASSIPPAMAPSPTKAQGPAQVVHITQIVVHGRPGHPDRALARGLEDSPIGLGALYDEEVRAAKDGPSVEALELMAGGRPCDLDNIEVFYRLGVAALASGDWSRAQRCFATVEEASPGYRDAGARVLELAGWQSMLARKLSVVGARKPDTLDAAASRYDVKGELGRGGMAVVYRATDTVLGREVALKFLSEELGSKPAMREMFQREARAVAQLNHPNIVTIHDSGVIEGRMFMAMELVDGRTVDQLIEAEGKVAVLEALRIARQVLEALEFSHARSIIHRDVKPSNMMRSTAGLVKLMDFGLAKALTPDSKSSVIAGTPAYMPPEQFIGEGVDLRSDLFAVGATLYEMLTGHLPFDGLDRTKRPRALRDATPTVPEIIERMVLQALDPDPDRRFQSATDFLAPIQRVLFAVERATRGSGPTTSDLAASDPAARQTEAATASEQAHVAIADTRVGPSRPYSLVASVDAALDAPDEELPLTVADLPSGTPDFIDFSDAPPASVAPPSPVPPSPSPVPPAPSVSSTKKTETGIVTPVIEEPNSNPYDPTRPPSR